MSTKLGVMAAMTEKDGAARHGLHGAVCAWTREQALSMRESKGSQNVVVLESHVHWKEPVTTCNGGQRRSMSAGWCRRGGRPRRGRGEPENYRENVVELEKDG
jgi:hypothetical protein